MIAIFSCTTVISAAYFHDIWLFLLIFTTGFSLTMASAIYYAKHVYICEEGELIPLYNKHHGKKAVYGWTENATIYYCILYRYLSSLPWKEILHKLRENKWAGKDWQKQMVYEYKQGRNENEIIQEFREYLVL